MTTCAYPPCDDDTAWAVTVGCVHEHVDTKLLCPLHASAAEVALRFDGGHMVCRRCKDQDGHECIGAVTVRPAP